MAVFVAMKGCESWESDGDKFIFPTDTIFTDLIQPYRFRRDKIPLRQTAFVIISSQFSFTGKLGS